MDAGRGLWPKNMAYPAMARLTAEITKQRLSRVQGPHEATIARLLCLLRLWVHCKADRYSQKYR